MYRLIPDWTKPKVISLVYPAGLKVNHARESREELVPFYWNFLDLLNDNEQNLTINLILQEEGFWGKDFKNTIEKMFKNLTFSYSKYNIHDIWVRDWGPVPIQNGDLNSSLKFIYDPDYCMGFTKNENIAGEHLQEDFYGLTTKIGMRWDGGNISTNGEYLFVTDKLVHLNPKIKDMRAELLKLFDLKDVFIIPCEKYDKIGHTDGIIRFLDKDTICLPKYHPDFDLEVAQIERLKERFKDKFKIINIPTLLMEDINKEGIYSAEGSYINYFRIEDRIYLPQYGLKEDISARKIFKEFGFNVIPVPHCKHLAFLGGVLNCITHHIY